ncbi:hypothetical protein C0J52_12630, partial [Blattella germanica]
ILYIPALSIVIEYGGDESFRQEVYRESSSDDDDRMNMEDMERIGEVIYQLILGMLIASLVLNMFLIIGGMTEMWVFFVPWIIEHTFSLSIVVLFVVSNLYAKIGDIKVRAVAVGGGVVHLLLTVYYLVVVFNTAREFRDKKKLKKRDGVILPTSEAMDMNQPLGPH